MLDFSLNKKVQQATERRDFFTNWSSENYTQTQEKWLDIQVKRFYEKGRFEYYNKGNTQNTVAHYLDILIAGHGISQYIYANGNDGNNLQIKLHKN